MCLTEHLPKRDIDAVVVELASIIPTVTLEPQLLADSLLSVAQGAELVQGVLGQQLAHHHAALASLRCQQLARIERVEGCRPLAV